MPLSYIIDYKLIKNLPFNLTQEIGPDALEYFKDKMTSRLKGANREINEEAIDRRARLSYEWKERELLERENSTKQPRD